MLGVYTAGIATDELTAILLIFLDILQQLQYLIVIRWQGKVF